MAGTLFVSYAREDEKALTEIRLHLRGAALSGAMALWDDTRLAAGDDWRGVIECALAGCDAAILLITPAFLGSPFIQGVEVPELLRRRAAEGMRIWPIYWRACDIGAIEWLPMMNIVPRAGPAGLKPLGAMARGRRDEALAALARDLRQHLTTLPATPKTDPEGEEWARSIEAMALPMIEGESPNRQPILKSKLRGAMNAARNWREAGKVDILRLADLAETLEGIGEDRFGGALVRFPALDALSARLREMRERCGRRIEPDEPMIALIERALGVVEQRLAQPGPCPARAALEGLRDHLLDSLAENKVRLGLMSQWSDAVEEADRACARDGIMALRLCIGRKAELAPPLACFRHMERLPEMVVVPTGEFWVGSQRRGEGISLPRTRIDFQKRFCLSRYPVARYEYFSLRNLYYNSRDLNSNVPICNISRNSATEFCREYRLLSNKNCDLPSEVRWEYCCRAGSDDRYPWGNVWDKKYVNCATSNINNLCSSECYPANSWGIYSMLGNCWEMCADDWRSDIHFDIGDNTFFSFSVGYHSSRENNFVIKGGSYKNYLREIGPEIRKPYNKNSSRVDLGFRIHSSMD